MDSYNGLNQWIHAMDSFNSVRVFCWDFFPPSLSEVLGPDFWSDLTPGLGQITLRKMHGPCIFLNVLFNLIFAPEANVKREKVLRRGIKTRY